MGRMAVPLGRFCVGGSYLPTYHWLLTVSCTRFLLGGVVVRSGVRTSGVPVSGSDLSRLGGSFAERLSDWCSRFAPPESGLSSPCSVSSKFLLASRMFSD